MKYEAVKCRRRECGAVRSDHVVREVAGVVRRLCPNGSGNWFQPRNQRIAASQSFNAAEVKILNFIFGTISRGGAHEFQVLRRNESFPALMQKIVKMDLRVRSLLEKEKELTEETSKDSSLGEGSEYPRSEVSGETR